MLHLLLIAAFESKFIRVSRYKKICLLALFTVSELLLSGDRFEIPNLGFSAVSVGMRILLTSNHLCFWVFLSDGSCFSQFGSVCECSETGLSHFVL